MTPNNSLQSNWREQQTLFGEALLDPTKKVPGFVGKTAGEQSHKRFNVYRNNVMVSLTEAIIDTYPVVAALVGEEFATAMARVYVGDHLPTSPVLIDYGKDYAAFIETFEPASSVPFLADIAKLEWSWIRSYHSADEIPLGIEVLGNYGEDELALLNFTFCQSVQLLSSNYPIVSIWLAHQDGSADKGLEQLSQSGECALLNRPFWDVEVRTLAPGAHAFFAALSAGFPLGISIDKGNSFSSFDPASAITGLFETNSIAAIETI